MDQFHEAMMVSVAAVAGLCLSLPAARAEDHFPTHPIQLIVPTPPGGGTDISARMIAKLAEPILHQQVVVLNKPGASGAVGMGAMLEAKHDGYTLAGVWNSPITVAPQVFHETYTRASYVPIELSDVAPVVYCVMKDFPANTGQELIKVLHDHPGKYTYGTDGVSGNIRFTAELIFSHFDAHMRAVPYNGAAETLAAFSGHYIDIYGGSTAPILPLVRNGTAKCLVASTAKRSPLLPGAASVTDLGIPQESTSVWHAIIAPADVPHDRLIILEHAFREAAASETYKKFAATQGEEAPALDSAEARALMDHEYDEFAGVIKQLGLNKSSKEKSQEK